MQTLRTKTLTNSLRGWRILSQTLLFRIQIGLLFSYYKDPKSSSYRLYTITTRKTRWSRIFTAYRRMRWLWYRTNCTNHRAVSQGSLFTIISMKIGLWFSERYHTSQETCWLRTRFSKWLSLTNIKSKTHIIWEINFKPIMGTGSRSRKASLKLFCQRWWICRTILRFSSINNNKFLKKVNPKVFLWEIILRIRYNRRIWIWEGQGCLLGT